jgi:hypothetical protein
MERRQRVRRAVALVSAVVLVGALVVYQAGGLSFLGGSKSNPVFKMVGSDKPAPQQQPKYLGGSKSTFIFLGNGVKPPDPPKPAEPPASSDPKPPAKPGE